MPGWERDVTFHEGWDFCLGCGGAGGVDSSGGGDGVDGSGGSSGVGDNGGSIVCRSDGGGGSIV